MEKMTKDLGGGNNMFEFDEFVKKLKDNPKTIVFSSIAFTYCFCPSVFGLTGLPDSVTQTQSLPASCSIPTSSPSATSDIM